MRRLWKVTAQVVGEISQDRVRGVLVRTCLLRKCAGKNLFGKKLV